ncbi:MAG: universal stress protein [Planctomycetota bacterium]
MSWPELETVVVPVDFSEESMAAIDTALRITGSAKALHVIHVLPELSPLEPGEMWETVDERTRTEHVEKTLRKSLSDPAYAGITIEILFGDPGHAISHRAAELKADMIVLPSHGRTGLAHLLIGSVAERVVRLAHCPVLVLRS